MTNIDIDDVNDPPESVKCRIVRLGDALDRAEHDFIALHPGRAHHEALWSSAVGNALDRYRAALRAEIGGKVPWLVLPPIEGATSLRDLVDQEAQQVRACHSLKLNNDFQMRVAERRQQWLADQRAGIVRRYSHRKPSIRSI